jgi:hypothetical protein
LFKPNSTTDIIPLHHSPLYTDLTPNQSPLSSQHTALNPNPPTAHQVASTIDQIIVPRESQWFGFFKPNSTTEIIPLHQSPLYTEDWIGLRALERAGKLHFASCACHHRDVPSDRCRVQVWDKATRRFLQPQGSLPALGRWLSLPSSWAKKFSWAEKPSWAEKEKPGKPPSSHADAQDKALAALAAAARARAAATKARRQAALADARARQLTEEARKHLTVAERERARVAAKAAGEAAAAARAEGQGGEKRRRVAGALAAEGVSAIRV